MSGSIRKAVVAATAVALTASGIALGSNEASEGSAKNTTAGETTQLELHEALAPVKSAVLPDTMSATTQHIQLASLTTSTKTTAKVKYWYQKNGNWYWTSHKSKYDAHIRGGGIGTGTAYPFSAEGQRLLHSKSKNKSTSGSNAPKPSASGWTGAVSGSGKYAAAASYALKQVGDPYVWGGNGPYAWDCSGLVKGSYAKAGKTLPRTAQAMSSKAYRISASSARPGDLVFWGSKGSAWHVGIYLGGGKYVHAANPRVDVTVYKTSYWAPGWYGRIS